MIRSLRILLFALCAHAAASAHENPGASDAPIPSGSVRIDWSARDAFARRLAMAGYIGAEAKLARIGDDHVRNIKLDSLLTFDSLTYEAWRKPFRTGNLDDTVRVDTLGFGALILNDSGLFMLPKPAAWAGYAREKPAPPDRESRASLPLPLVFRIGCGYPDFAFAQAGMVIGPPDKDDLSGVLVAGEADPFGFGIQAGLAVIFINDRHMIPAFGAFGAEYHRAWSEPKRWHAGPFLQLGLFNLGFEAGLWAGSGYGGSASLLIQILPFPSR